MAPHRVSFQEQEELPRETWQNLPKFPRLTASTIPNLGPSLFIHSPTTIFKLGREDDGEGIMTALAHSMLGSCVPRVISLVTISSMARHGVILTHQPGTPLVELWPSLSSSQREVIKTNLSRILLRMRAHHFAYYGRPQRQPYVIFDDFGIKTHYYCTSRAEWDDSRVRALHNSSSSDAKRADTLESVQRKVSGPSGWDRPVLTHGDLSNRNILVHPRTLDVTGFLDWEMANIMPAYYEYIEARLSGGHDPEWRRELLDILRSVLRGECESKLEGDLNREKRYERTMEAWNAMLNVERIAQEYNDDCFWTFETGLPDR